MPAMALELVPLGTLAVVLRAPIMLPGTPFGSRVVGEVESARLEGERVNASMKGVAAADWLITSADGTVGRVDVRVTLETDDGALIYVHYLGRFDLTTFTVYTAPLFETGDERYAWLNKVQAVAKGTFADMSHLTYEVFEVR